MEQTMMERLRGEWWWRVGRHLTREAVCWKIARLLPRRIALLAYIRVAAASTDSPDESYVRCCKGWEAGAGR